MSLASCVYTCVIICAFVVFDFTIHQLTSPYFDTEIALKTIQMFVSFYTELYNFYNIYWCT